MKSRTHLLADPSLCGEAIELREGFAQAELEIDDRMVVDEQGLVHGGFVFGLADYAAMLAVNDPNVVLGGAEVRFLKPAQPGTRVVATARIVETSGRKRTVAVEASVDSVKLFEGTFQCFVLDQHVLKKPES